MRTFRDFWAKLQRSVGFRKAFVGAEVKRLIPFQISALRNARGWSQEELARRSGLTQGAISRAEDPDYGNLTFNTLIRIANGFDVAFLGRFVPYSELGLWYVKLTEKSAGDVANFETENANAARLLALWETTSRSEVSVAANESVIDSQFNSAGGMLVDVPQVLNDEQLSTWLTNAPRAQKPHKDYSSELANADTSHRSLLELMQGGCANGDNFRNASQIYNRGRAIGVRPQRTGPLSRAVLEISGAV